MPYDIATLLTRNLHEIFGEGDDARRRATAEEIFTEDAVFYEPNGVTRGRDEIVRVAGVIRATHPDFQYTVLRAPKFFTGDPGASMGFWPPGAPPAYAGTDVVIATHGRIAEIHLFFDALPAAT